MSTSAPQGIAALEADIAERRERLAGTLQALHQQTRPQAIMARRTEAAKASFASLTRNDQGGIKPEVMAVAGGVVALVIGAVVLRGRRKNRGA